jgi:hypothetical protein
MRPMGQHVLLLALLCAIAAPALAQMSVRHDGRQWVLRAERADRVAVWQALAAASGSRLSLAPGASGGRALSLHWRGARLDEAWRRVLGDDLNHALQCEAGRCRVWVLGPVHGGGAAVVAATAGPVSPGWAARSPDPVRAAGGDPADPRLPDPPGLFASP